MSYLRKSFVAKSSLVHAASTEMPADHKVGEAGTKQTQDIVKTVYINGDASLKAVKLHVMNAADATLGLIAAMVVHLIVRTYHSNDQERRDHKQTKAELLSAFQEFAEAKRNKPYEHAWLSRLLNAAYKEARSMITDFKGIAGPVTDILRAKKPETAIDLCMARIKQKTKGSNAFTALEKAHLMNDKVIPRKTPVTADGKVKGRGSNATLASKDSPDRIAKAIMGDKGSEIINAMPGKAKAKAIIMADKIGGSNVDFLTFAMRFIGNLQSAEDCLAVSNAALERMKELSATAIKGKGKKPAVVKTEEPAVAATG